MGGHSVDHRCCSIYLDGTESERNRKIKTGIEKIAGGEVDYQIPVNGLLAEHKEIAEKGEFHRRRSGSGARKEHEK